MNLANPQIEDPKQEQPLTLPKTNNAILEELLNSLLGPDIENSDLLCPPDPARSATSLLARLCKISGSQTLSDLEAHR